MSFTAAVSGWVSKSERRMEAVRIESTELVIEAMQEVGPSVTNPDSFGTGNMPVASGFLRRSLMVSTSQMPTINPQSHGRDGQSYNFDNSAITLAIAGSDAGDTVYAGYTAAYAAYVEYGVNGRSGRRFVALAAQRWPQIVAFVVRRVRATVH